MSGFSNVLKAELYKIAKAKSLIKVLIAIVIIFTLISVGYSLIYKMIGDQSIVTPVEINEETVEAAEAAAEDYKAMQDGMKSNVRFQDSGYWQVKSTAVLYRYMYDNGLDFSSVSLFGSATALTANAYILYMLQIMSVVITVYAAITMARSFAGERSNGTLKMQLLKPISKESMMFAKMLSTFIVSVGLYLFTFILSSIVGIIAFDVDAKDVLVVFNATSVAKISAVGELLIYFLYYVYSIGAYIVLALFLSNIIKKSEGAAIAILMLLMFLGATFESVLGYLYIGYIGFNINMSWISALQITGPAMNYMNLYSLLAISLVWMAGMIVSSLFMFKKADIHN